MAKKKGGSKKESQRRKEQSNRDKKKTPRARQVSMPRMVKSKQKTRQTGGGSMPYARLILDPCNASFCQTNLPGSSGSQQARCPFRQILTVPTPTTGITGTAVSAADCNTLLAVLTPHAMFPGFGPSALSYRANSNETSTMATTGLITAPAFYGWTDPAGLSALTSFVGEMRPVAACVRITCLGSDVENSGLFFGYEGAAKDFITHVDGDFKNSYAPATSAQNIIFNGQTSGDTYKTYEVRVNYPNAPVQWQDWRKVASDSTTTGIPESGDAADVTFDDMPIAMVGVTSAKPGTKYLIDGAIVYEWQPKSFVGLVAPKKEPSNPGALASVARTVQMVANKWGGMLISSAANYATGGNASAVMGLLRQGYSAYTAGRPNQPLLGWK